MRQIILNFFKSVISIVKVLFLSHHTKLPHVDNDSTLIIMGNGPSLRKNFSENLDELRAADTLAVNFAANAPEFYAIKPNYYVIADPHFNCDSDDVNVNKLISSLKSIDWPLYLFVPSDAKKWRKILSNPHIEVIVYNLLAIEGYRWLKHYLFRHGYGMPRPRNVMIPSIMLGMMMGYKQIYLLGADHSWLKTLGVDDDNKVVNIQPHFYEEDKNEKIRISSVYENVRLHQVLESMMIAFRGYHELKDYAQSEGVSIFNATPHSMIDAFTRKNWPEVIA